MIKIAVHAIGFGEPPYIVAEMSGNHDDDISRAFRILDAARVSGADAIENRTCRAESITIDHTNVRSIEPSNGLKPKYLAQVIGRKANRDIAFGEPMYASMTNGGLTL